MRNYLAWRLTTPLTKDDWFDISFLLGVGSFAYVAMFT